MRRKYRVVIAQSGKADIVQKKQYILQKFKYRKYAESYSQQVKKSVKELEVFPAGYEVTGFRYRGYDIYIKPQRGYLLFYVVDERLLTVTVLRVLQNGMDWQKIIQRWVQENS